MKNKFLYCYVRHWGSPKEQKRRRWTGYIKRKLDNEIMKRRFDQVF